MAFKDLLLALTTYTEPTPISAVDTSIAFAGALGAKISAIACEIKLHMPWSPFTGAFPEIPALAATEEKKSQSNAEKLLAAFQDSAEKSGVFQDRIVERCQTSEVPDVLTGYARVRDLIIVPVPEGDNIQQWYAESVIFGSGRPVLIIPQSEKPAAGFALDTVVVAWDFSRPASRAVADALPILEKAKRVHVVTVTNEKMIAAKRARNDGRTGMARTFC